MSWFSRIAATFRHNKEDHELAEELRSHQEMRARDNIQAGMSAHEAGLDARRRFGNSALIQEQTRAQHLFVWLETLLQDTRYGLRTLRRAPGFTLAAIVTMALSIGAVTAIFTLVESILLRPLPYQDPARLVSISTFMPKANAEVTVSPDYFAWRDSSRALAGVAAYSVDDFNFSGAGDPDRLQGAFTTANFFSVLGVRPYLGRTYSAAEDKPESANVIVLTYGLWQSRFHGAAGVLGRQVLIDGEPSLVIGVLPREFRFPSAQARPELLAPMRLHEFKADPKQPMRILQVLARMRPEVSLALARADVQTISDRLMAQYSEGYQRFFAGRTVNVRGLRSELVGVLQRALLVALAAVGFVLLIGCLNITSLQLARAVQRGPEVGVRSALGAGKGRLMRQFFTESLALSCCGALAGIVLAFAAVSLAGRAKLRALPAYSDLHVDGWVLAFAAFITIASGLFFGFAPALWALRSDPANAISRGARATYGALHRRMRNLLVVAELAVALVLLAGAGLMIHSFVRLLTVEAGFNPHHLLTARINLLEANYPTAERKIAFAQQLTERLRALGDVESVAISTGMPLLPYNGGMGLFVEDKPEPPAGMAPIISGIEVQPGYFHALQISLLAGRDFVAADSAAPAPVAIVNRAFVRRFFSGGEALGKRFRGSRQGSPWITIVGVVDDVRHNGLDQDVSPEFYSPLSLANTASLVIALRTHDASGAAAAIRNQVKAIDANQPVFNILAMDELLADSLATRRLSLALLGSFALLALGLAAIGLYGVLSYSVAHRSQEIGIRMALGSTQTRVLNLVLREAVLLALAGVVLGIAGALVLTRFMASLLYNTRAYDPLTMIAVSALLLVVGLLAGYLPARRASKVDPMIALRAE